MSALVQWIEGYAGIWVPYAMAGLGGAVTERSGVPHIALEACMAAGAVAAIAGELAGAGVLGGAVCAAAAGGFVGILHAFSTQALRVDGVVSGFALNLGTLAATRAALRILYGSSSNSPSTIASAYARGLRSPYLVVSLLLAALVPLWLGRSRFGLQLRSVGDNPTSAHALGVHDGHALV